METDINVNPGIMTFLRNLILLQDVVQFGPLSKTLGLVMLTKPQILPSIFKQVRVYYLSSTPTPTLLKSKKLQDTCITVN